MFLNYRMLWHKQMKCLLLQLCCDCNESTFLYLVSLKMKLIVKSPKCSLESISLVDYPQALSIIEVTDNALTTETIDDVDKKVY